MGHVPCQQQAGNSSYSASVVLRPGTCTTCCQTTPLRCLQVSRSNAGTNLTHLLAVGPAPHHAQSFCNHRPGVCLSQNKSRGWCLDTHRAHTPLAGTMADHAQHSQRQERTPHLSAFLTKHSNIP